MKTAEVEPCEPAPRTDVLLGVIGVSDRITIEVHAAELMRAGAAR